MRDMPIFAGPSWSKLSDGQKYRYNVRAKSGAASGTDSGLSPPNGGGAAVAGAVKAAGNAGRRDCAGNLITVGILHY